MFFIILFYVLVEFVAFLDSLELKKARKSMVLVLRHRDTILAIVERFLF